MNKNKHHQRHKESADEELCELDFLRAKIVPSDSLVARIIGAFPEEASGLTREPHDKSKLRSPYFSVVAYMRETVRSPWKLAAPIAVLFFGIVSVFGAVTHTSPTRFFAKADDLEEIMLTLSREADGDAAILSSANEDIALLEADTQVTEVFPHVYDETIL